MEKLKYFKSEKISERITRITGLTGELMYLVEGKNKAVLIDTGTGIGNLKKYVEKLTQKPVIVLLTHGHVDHAMGASAFEEVYMNPADKNVYMEHSDISVRMEYLKMFLGENFKKVKEEDYIPAASSYSFKPLLPGNSFELGGITLEIYGGAGHTPGMITILFVEERTLLLGDACNFFTFLFDKNSLDLITYEKNLKELDNQTKGRYDKVYLSHGDGDASKDMIQSVIKVCEDIKSGKSDDIPFNFLGETAYIAKAVDVNMARIDGGLGNIVYSKEKVHK
ncbi:MBL fold metallo-hydrolase [Clostridium sp. SYSU_GA19001]|uniref:MBL fold metallo-hydrolase n=1 Tax=Clostridium caldaquaticum TaxID=2940653 RepID=UPI00207701D7|nr:MBL fold metallo-hydrolase [Clostridium caldaquaticum]MCM8711527.1 MBL fold metallo-hydrolase [Clostridium caldaquaticum]